MEYPLFKAPQTKTPWQMVIFRRSLCRFSIGRLLVTMVVVGVSGCGTSEPKPEETLLRQLREREMAQLSQPRSREQQLESVRHELQLRNLTRASRLSRELLVANPNDSEVIFLAAEVQAASGDKLAAADILQAIPDDDLELGNRALREAAHWLVDAGEPQQAIDRLHRNLQVHGESNWVHHELARLLNHLGRRIEAAEHLQFLARGGDISEKELFALVTLGNPYIDVSMPKPDFSDASNLAALAVAKVMRVENQLNESRVLTERLQRRFPDSTQVSAFLGRIYSDLHDDVSLSKLLQQTPDGIEREPEYWFALGMLLQRQEQHQQAVRCFGEAVLRDHTDRFSYLAMARSLTLSGEHDRAGRVLRRFELLEETSRLGREFGAAAGTMKQLSRMADILEQLQRPWEAIGWLNVALKTHGSTKGQLADLQAHRQSLLADAADQPERWPQDFLTCGINLSDWPLPSTGMIGQAIVSDTRPNHSRSSGESPITLRDVAADVGLGFQYDNGDKPGDNKKLLHQLTGGGIGVIDVDLDGYCDLYFTQGGGDAFQDASSKPNRLFRNLSGQRFVDVTIQMRCGDLGYGQGVAVADLNQDGFPDLLVANVGPNLMYLNNGDGTFARHRLPLSSDDGAWTSSIACGDISGDHLPDILEVNYVDDPSALTIPCTVGNRERCNPSRFQPAADHVWRVGSDMSISSWTGCVEMNVKPSYGFAAVIADFDGNAGNEIFIANDGEQNHFWVSQPGHDAMTRKLLESSRIYGCDVGLLGDLQGSMGVAFGDFDHNGKLDLHVTNFWDQPADLYLQNPSGLFFNANVSRGIARYSQETVGWGTQAVDFDRDGWLDLAVMNGHLIDLRDRRQPFKMRAQLFRGGPEGFRFVKPNADDYWSRRTLGRTMAVLDWNADGQPDLVTNHLDVPVALLENHTESAHSVQIELVGTTSERDATGATVTVTCRDQVWTGWLVGGDGFLCSNEQVVDFGVGDAEIIDRLEVHWPSGETQRFESLEVGNRYLIIEGDQEAFQRITH